MHVPAIQNPRVKQISIATCEFSIATIATKPDVPPSEREEEES